MNAIEIKKLTKKFKDKVAVNNINLEVKEGELFALLGTNGAGKTTLMKTIVGINKVQSGNIEYNGKEISNQHNRRTNFNISTKTKSESYYEKLVVKSDTKEKK